MPSIRSNAIRIKRFRELKADLRTKRDRLLVGIDIAKAQHVAQVRLAHTRILDKQLGIPNTEGGFAAFWVHLQRRQQETGCIEIVCAMEPTGTYHQALATFLEGHGVDVVLVAPQVAHHNRRTLDGTWGKTDPKDAHNLGDLLERGHVLFYSLPDEQTATLRRLVRLLRHARTEFAACKARFRNTLLPALAPAGAPLPPAVIAALPAPLQLLLPAAQRRALPAVAAALPAACACDLIDLAARVGGVRTRLAALEAALVTVATPLPAYRLLLTIPGLGPTLAAILVAELGDLAWDQPVQSAPQARGPRYHLGGDGAVDRDSPDLPGGGARCCAGRAPRRPWGRPGPRRGARTATGCGRSGRGIPTPSSRRTWSWPRSSSGWSGASGGVGAPTTPRGSAAAPRSGRRPSRPRRRPAAAGPHLQTRGDRRSGNRAPARLVEVRTPRPRTR